MEREIIVQGSAEVRVPPDRAYVFVTIDADAGSRDDAYAKATTSANAVDDVLRLYASAIERTVTDTLSVQPLTRWRKGESVRTGWRASRRSTVEVVAFERLGELLADLAPLAILAGPQWVVDRTNPAYVEVRSAAAADARARAEAYAAALDLRISGVAWVAEPGLRLGSGQGNVFGSRMAMAQPDAMGYGGAEDEIIDVEPEDTVIDATVEVGFAIAAND